METLLGKFENYVAEHNICSHGDRILLAVSGGVDSMVMLSLFAQSGYRIGVAHCNFQLRGPEAEEDEQLVAECAESSVYRTTTSASIRSGRWSVPGNRCRWLRGGCATTGSTASATNTVIRTSPLPTTETIRWRLFYQPVARHRAARTDRNQCDQRAADPAAALLHTQGDFRLCAAKEDSFPRGFVERFDQIPAQQKFGWASSPVSRKFRRSSPKR